MKTIRISVTLAGLAMAILALGAVGAKAQVIESTHFKGEFTLPLDTQWGSMALPAGNYTLEYGNRYSGSSLVVVRGKAKGSPRGIILAQQPVSTSTTKNAIVCVREGNALVVRTLEMPAIGEAIQFRLPHGKRLVANQRNHNGYAQIAEAPMLIQRLTVTPIAN